MKLEFLSYDPLGQLLKFRINKTHENDENTIYHLRQKLRTSVEESIDMRFIYDKETGVYSIAKCHPVELFVSNEKKHFLEQGVSLCDWNAFEKQIKQKKLSHKNSHDYIKLSNDFISLSFPFIADKELVRLSTVSTLFRQKIQCHFSWKEKLVEAGCDRNLLESANKLLSIFNYKNLYKTFIRIEYPYRKQIKNLWEILCLSGDINTIRCGIQKKIICADITNTYGENAIHLVAFSGNAAALDFIIRAFPINHSLKLTSLECNLVHMAAQSGDLDTIRRAAQVPGIQLDALTKNKNHVLHMIVRYGCDEGVDWALQIPNVDPLAITGNKLTLLHMAVLSNNVALMNRVAQIKNMNFFVFTDTGQNIMHFATRMGNIEAMKWIVANITGINFADLTLHKFNLLHLAVLSQNPLAILFIRELNVELNLGLDPNTLNNAGKSAFSFVDDCLPSKRVELVKALTVPIEPAVSFQNETRFSL